MILSCTTCSLRGRGRDEIEETFRWAPEAGFTAWGLGGPFTWEPGLIQWMDTAKVKQAALAVGLTRLTEVWTPPIPTDSPERALEGAAHIAMSAQAAVELGCDLLVQTGGPRSEGALARTLDGLRRLDETLGDLPVRVALEPHVGSQILYAEEYDRLMAELPFPRFGITVDTGHFHTAGVDWKALIRRYPERIYNVHLKDHIGPQSVAIGQGEIDLPGLILALREIGYEGALAIEMEVTDPENLHLYVKQAHAHILRLLGEG
jgi:sugar phosphate isomerase/epimerase